MKPKAARLVRAVIYLAVVYLIWQGLYKSGKFSELLFPSMNEILSSLWRETLDGTLPKAVLYSLGLILEGMGLAVALAAVLAVPSMLRRWVRELISSLISVFDPLPGIAILPVAILWFGIGRDAIIFVMVYSIVWPFLLNIIGAFSSVPPIYRDVGLSFGLHGLKLVFGVYLPACVPGILTGFKTGWSRAWRALISAEMVFGATGASGGLGWDIYQKKAFLDMPGMFATLIVIMLIGVIVDKAVFNSVERATVKKWGMSA